MGEAAPAGKDSLKHNIPSGAEVIGPFLGRVGKRGGSSHHFFVRGRNLSEFGTSEATDLRPT